jgi:hypothetical protein
VPTTLEAEFANSDYNYWMGILVPSKTPRDIPEPGVVAKFKPQEIEPLPLSPTEFDALIANAIEINKAKAAGPKFN